MTDSETAADHRMGIGARLSLCLLAALSALALLTVLLRVSAAPPPEPAVGAAGRVPARAESPPALHRLTHEGHSTPWAWTPDGGHLLVQRPGRTLDGQQLSELWIVSALGGSERRLAENALYPAAHQGQVAYLRYEGPGEWQAVVADLATGAILQARPARWNAAPRWVDGNAWTLGPSMRWQSSAGELASLELPVQASAARARLSPTGLLAASTDGRTLWVSDRDGTQAIARGEQVHGFAWSPDGRRLAYVTAEGGAQPELWAWDRETGRARQLLRGELEHMGEPAWSPDGRRLAIVRAPTGNLVAGAIWLVDVDQAGSARRLTTSEADENAPCWSPDGRRLAFSADGDLYMTDPDAPLPRGLPPSVPPVQPTGERGLEPLGLTAPTTVWVKHDASRNTCRNVPDGQIDAIPLEQYVKQVVPHEVYTSWPTETLKTQAVAARTYVWVKWLDQQQQGRDYTVWDSTLDQHMCDTTEPRTDRAVEATLGEYVASDGRVIWAFYSAEAGHVTNHQRRWLTSYTRPVYDPGGLGQTRRGHGVGMSQWGAQRWADGHGWTYQQILAFYYTGTTVEPSTERVWPLAAVVLPWSNSFVTRDTMDLRALATSAKTVGQESGVLTVTLSARFTDTWTLIYTDTYAGDGWGTLWPLHGLSDTITPSIALRATAYDLVGWMQESAPSYVGINRTSPTGTLDLHATQVTVAAPAGTPTAVPTLTLALAVSATDTTPTYLPLRVSLSAEHWVWEDRDLAASGGATVADPTAWDGSAWHVEAGESGVLASPEGQPMPAGIHRAWVRLRVPTQTLSETHEIVRLAALNAADELLGIRYLRGAEFKAGETYQEFGLDLVTAEDEEVWWYIDSFSASALWIDRISVAGYPVELPNDGQPLAWTLPPHEGPVTVTARYVDGAENVSTRVLLPLTVVDLDPPSGWRNLHCQERACSVQVRDAIAGLDTESGAARASFDGGDTWTLWMPVTCTGEMGSHAWETLYLPGLEPEAQALSTPLSCEAQIQFRVRDVAAAPNEGLSPVYTYDNCFHLYLPNVPDAAVLTIPLP